jgi:prepilin-type N-terminal cleavage/methylation domain-containing protein
MKRKKIGRHDGFTLLEVVVSLAVLSLGVTLTLSLISGSLRNIRNAQLRGRVVQHAETVMETILLDDTIRQATTLPGDFQDGTRWLAKVEEFQQQETVGQTLTPQQAGLPLRLLSYTVEVFSPGSNTADFTLRTLKLVNTQTPLNPVQLTQ